MTFLLFRAALQLGSAVCDHIVGEGAPLTSYDIELLGKAYGALLKSLALPAHEAAVRASFFQACTCTDSPVSFPAEPAIGLGFLQRASTSAHSS